MHSEGPRVLRAVGENSGTAAHREEGRDRKKSGRGLPREMFVGKIPREMKEHVRTADVV